MTLPRILIASPFDPAGVEFLREAAEVDFRPDLTPDELESLIGPYNALIVNSETRVGDRVIEYAYQLQVIGVAGASLDRLNVSAARAQNVEIINVPDPRTLAQAEEALRLMLVLTYRHGAPGLAGKTIGIIGFGGTGHEVARRARAFDMRVLVYQPLLTPELALEVGVELRELHALLAEADYISLHVPETPETRPLIAAGDLAHCRPTAFLINTSHAQAVDLEALHAAVEAGQLAGAAVTGLSNEASLERDGFSTRRNRDILVVPRVGPNRAEARRDTALALVRHVIAALRSRRTGNPLSLRIVPLDRVLPHEHFDPIRVADLAIRLKTAESLVNPPVVIEWKSSYVVLDGATRVNAFRQLEYPHIAVQIVPANEEKLQLHTWYHAVCCLTIDNLLVHLQKVPECELFPAPRETHQAALDSGAALCSLVTVEDEAYLVYAAKGVEPLTALNALVAAYGEVGKIVRTLSITMADLQAEYPDIVALIVFPQFTLMDVLQAAVNGQLLPAGMTRFLIPGRVLRLHADLARLRADEPLTSKNAWLDQLLADKLARRRIRYYQEPVFLLDE